MDFSYLFLSNIVYEERLVSSTISSCLDINVSLDFINEQYDFLYFEMPKMSILDKIVGKIFILEKKFKIKKLLSAKCEYITKRYIILRTTRLALNRKMVDYPKTNVEKNNQINIKKNEYKMVRFLKKETKNLFESFYPKYVYFLLRKDNLFNNRLIKIRGDTKSINNYFFAT